MAAVMMVVLTSLIFMTLEGGLDRCSVLGVAKGRMNNERAVFESEGRRARSRDRTTGWGRGYHVTIIHCSSCAPSRESLSDRV